MGNKTTADPQPPDAPKKPVVALAPDVLQLTSTESKAEALCECVEDLALQTVEAMMRPSAFAAEGRDRARSRLKSACLLLIRPMLRTIEGGRQ